MRACAGMHIGIHIWHTHEGYISVIHIRTDMRASSESSGGNVELFSDGGPEGAQAAQNGGR